MSFDIEPAHRTDPISKEQYYELRLRPVKDLETGVTEDEIDRLMFELEMKNIDLQCVRGWLSEAKELLRTSLAVMNKNGIVHAIEGGIKEFLKEDL